MIEKHAAGRGQRDALRAADHQRAADLLFEVTHLAAQRGLGGVQPLLGGDCQAALLGDRDEIAKMPQLHDQFHASQVWHSSLQSLFPRRQRYLNPQQIAAGESAVDPAAKVCHPSLPVGDNPKGLDHEHPDVLITGALTGIGRAAAVAFAKKGAKVWSCRSARRGRPALVEELRSFGSEAEFINADVRHEDDVRALVDKTIARFGRLDVAVNNAGTEGRSRPDHRPDRGELCRDLRHQRSRRDPQHEARSARHAGTGQRHHRQHLLDLRA